MPRSLSRQLTDLVRLFRSYRFSVWTLFSREVRRPKTASLGAVSSDARHDITCSRSFLVRRFCEGLSILAPITAVVYWVLGVWFAALCGIFTGLCAAASLVVIARGHDAGYAAHIAIGGLWACVLATVLGSGGLDSPMLVGAILFPALAGLTIGGTSTLVWGIAGAVIPGLAMGLEVAGTLPSPFVLSSAPVMLRVACIVVACSIAVLAMLLQRRLFEQASRSLEAARVQAESADELKSTILRAVGRELRAPLARILKRSAELKIKSEQMSLNEVEASSRELGQLVENVLDFAEISSGHTKPHLTRVNPAEFTIVHLRKRAHIMIEKGLRLEFGCGETVPPDVMGDPYQLARCMDIALTNVARFTKQGSIYVIVSDREAVIRWTVMSDGMAVNRATKTEILSQIGQTKFGNVRLSHGFGLDIALLSVFANAWGGRAGFSAPSDHGGGFWFELPTNGGATSRPALLSPG